MTVLETINAVGQLHQARADFEKTLVLIQGLKTGQITLEEIQLVEGGWRIVPKADLVLPAAVADRCAGIVTAEHNGDLK